MLYSEFIYFRTNGRLLHVMFMEKYFFISILLPAYPGRCRIIMLLWINQDKCILLLITRSNCIYFRGFRTKTLEDWVRDRMTRKRRRPAVEKDRILISQRSEIKLGENRALDKFKIVKAITQDESIHKPGWSDDAKCMRSFLANLDPTSLQDPEITPWLDFIPENSPLVDYLVVHSEENEDTWKLPTLNLLKKLQDTRTLLYDLIDQCKVREIIVGESSTAEVKEYITWIITMHEKDMISLPCSGLSVSILNLTMSLRDIYRMSGLIPIPGDKKIISKELELNVQDGWKDEWKVAPVKILVGNGVDWAGVISVDLGTAGKP